MPNSCQSVGTETKNKNFYKKKGAKYFQMFKVTKAIYLAQKQSNCFESSITLVYCTRRNV